MLKNQALLEWYRDEKKGFSRTPASRGSGLKNPFFETA
jgi:hypothetical protein